MRKRKTAYFTALREAMPELIKVSTARDSRPVELEMFIAAFSVASEKQEKAADQKTLMLLQRFSGNAGVERARAEFEGAQKIERTLHKDFDGIWRQRFIVASGRRWLSA